MNKLLYCAVFIYLLIALLLVGIANAASTVTQVQGGGTGWGNFVTGTVLYGNGAGRLSTTTAATNGMILSWVNGIPTPVSTSTYTYPLSFNAATNAVSTAATSTQYGTCTAGQVIGWTNGILACVSTSTTAVAAGTMIDFSPGYYAGFPANSTSTQIRFTGTPFSIIASSTFFTQASTTQLTVTGNTNLTGLTGPAALAITSTGLIYPAATTTGGNPTGSVGATSATNGTATTYMRSDAVPGCTAATASVPGCIAAVDFATFAGKLNLSNLFAPANVYGQAGLGTSTMIYLTGAPYSLIASSTFVSNYERVGTSTSTIWPFVSASSTGAQIAISDNNPADFTWTMRAINNNFYLATSSTLATSTVAAITMNGITSAVTFSAGATSTFTSGLNVAELNINGTASSTAGNGINLLKGCFSIAGACVGASGGGSGTVSGTGSAGQGAYYTGATTVSPTSTLFIASNTNVGISTTSPIANLAVSMTGSMMISSTSVWNANATPGVPAGTVAMVIQAWGGGGAGASVYGGGAGAFVGSTTILAPSGTITITIGQGGNPGLHVSAFTGGTGGTGLFAGGNGVTGNASNNGGGGGGGSTGVAVNGTTIIASGGGGAGSNNNGPGNGATGNSGGAGGNSISNLGAGGGGGSGTVGSNGSLQTGGAGGTGGTTQTGTNGGGANASGATSAGVSGNGNNGNTPNTAAGANGSGGAAGGIASTGNGADDTTGIDSGGGGGSGGAPSGNGGVPGAGAGGAGAGLAGTGGHGRVRLTFYSLATPLMTGNQSVFYVQGPPTLAATIVSQIIFLTNYVTNEIDSLGHMLFGGPTPSVLSCGTASVAGNDNTGVITSSGATACTLMFANVWSGNAPVCMVTINVTGITYGVTSISNSSATFSFSGSVATIYYHCFGRI